MKLERAQKYEKKSSQGFLALAKRRAQLFEKND
jgi:hypothetical protein